ncbi:MAG: hypothetical protein K2K46_03345 [Lachnospiraceae bacterium]|nr:hypothetical protein [Lachnospiraceae bacterium]
MALRLIGRDEKSFVISHNKNAEMRNEARNNKGKGVKLTNKSINMSGLNGDKDALTMRKQLARKKAMKIISDAWAGDKKIDLDISEIKYKRNESNENISEYNDYLKGYDEKRTELKEYYGISDYTDEDIKLLNKKLRSEYNSKISFTQEEQDRLAELNEEAYLKYKEQTAGIDMAAAHYEKLKDDESRMVEAYNSEITGINLERLKFHKMLDAQQEAEEINKEASEDAINTLIGEAQEHIEETHEEKWEEAKEAAEKKEEQEEKIEEQRQEKEEFQEQLEIKREESSEAEETRIEQAKKAREQGEIIEGATEYMGGDAGMSSDVKAAIKDMLNKMKVLEEDLKGAEIDDKL